MLLETAAVLGMLKINNWKCISFVLSLRYEEEGSEWASRIDEYARHPRLY